MIHQLIEKDFADSLLEAMYGRNKTRYNGSTHVCPETGKLYYQAWSFCWGARYTNSVLEMHRNHVVSAVIEWPVLLTRGAFNTSQRACEVLCDMVAKLVEMVVQMLIDAAAERGQRLVSHYDHWLDVRCDLLRERLLFWPVNSAIDYECGHGLGI